MDTRGVTGSQQPDWYLREWAAFYGKRQSSLVNELGWNKSRANYIWHSRQPYSRELVNEIAAWLGIKPFELLMPPVEATALRRLRETAALIVAENDTTPFEHPPKAGQTKPGRRSAG